VIGLAHVTPVLVEASTCPDAPVFPPTFIVPVIVGPDIAGLVIVGPEIVGPVANTNGPEPVSSVTTAARFAEVVEPRKVANAPVTPCAPALRAVL
jgi:hypothetical protein